MGNPARDLGHGPQKIRLISPIDPIFFVPARELGSEVTFFGGNENFSESGLTKWKSVVYLCPVAPDDGDVGGCGAEKNPEKKGFLI